MKFEYLTPTSLTESLELRRQHSDRAVVIAGGTDLMVQIKGRRLNPEYVIDISRIPGLDGIDYSAADGLRIGALTTIRDIERSEVIRQRYPALAAAAGMLGSPAIRNVATIGGNLCNAAPSADTAPALIGFDASVKIVCPESDRMITLKEFFVGPGDSACAINEIVTEIQLPPPADGTRSAYLKHNRSTVDLALVGVAVVLEIIADNICHDSRIVLGAVAPKPLRARQAESILNGQMIDASLIEAAADAAAAESKPISDVRATAEYRREIVRVLTRRAIHALTASGY